jgi:prepilin-type processing-associated H-X9-DG protein
LTVIQLVAVCFVITVLLLLLGPFLLRKREAARRALCVSNLKQLGLGVAQYYCDHNTNGGPYGMPPMANVNTFARHLDMYIGSEARLFFCPVDRQRRPTTNITNLTQSSYAIVTNAVWQSATEAPLLLDQFQPTGIAVMTGSNRWSRASSAHKDGGHVLWTDGHVDWNTSLDVGTNRYPVAND